jgi:hypothetical protein
MKIDVAGELEKTRERLIRLNVMRRYALIAASSTSAA